jgi:hypothetical protein
MIRQFFAEGQDNAQRSLNLDMLPSAKFLFLQIFFQTEQFHFGPADEDKRFERAFHAGRMMAHRSRRPVGAAAGIFLARSSTARIKRQRAGNRGKESSRPGK